MMLFISEDMQADLEDESKEIKRHLEELRDMRVQLQALKDKMNTLTESMGHLKRERDAFRQTYDSNQMEIFTANFVSVFIEALCERTGKKFDQLDDSGQDEHHRCDRSGNASTLMKADNWVDETFLPTKQFDDLLKASTTFQKRDILAHQSNGDFARLLIDPHFLKHDVKDETSFYRPLFAYVNRDHEGTGLTLQEIATMEQGELDDYFPKGQDESVCKKTSKA
ncbi:MAG: hypothetical protein Q9220_001123 [cf. Caloplaca sp. 1 TL-2023]